jgi:hypothetical protein
VNLSSDDTFDAPIGIWEAFAQERVEPSSETAWTSEISRRLQFDLDDSQRTPLSHHEVENYAKKWLGGVLAVLGAVIGSVALHNVQLGDGIDEPHDRRQPIGE